MLILSRKTTEKIVFPSLGVSVEVLCVSGNKVRLGIEAPVHIPVHRNEVIARMGSAADARHRPK